MQKVTAFAPATVANISCGFDVLGLALQNIGDQVAVQWAENKEISIISISGDDNLSKDPEKNVCGKVALCMLEERQEERGLSIHIEKGVRGSSGLGSSAASAVATVAAVNGLMENVYDNHALLEFAAEGEKLASGSRHADNITPALLGGITLVRDHHTFDVISLPVPKELQVVVLFPNIKINTQDARRILKTKIDFSTASTQWANLAGFVAGIHQEDYELIGRSMKDLIVEPVRSLLIPNFQELKIAAMDNGALGFGISGSGPSVFALVRGEVLATEVGQAMREAYNTTGIEFELFSGSINPIGAHLIDL